MNPLGTGDSRVGGRTPFEVQAPLVLVIDDDPDARTVWAECVSQLGYRTATEATGESGIRAAQREPPAAILMDFAMPGINGIETARRMKADSRIRDAFVILVTSRGPEVFDEARAAGCDAYFCKPFNAFTFGSILKMLTTRPAHGRRSGLVLRCACRRSYTHDIWATLRLCGAISLPNSDEILEVRHCHCGNCIVMSLDGASQRA